MNALGDLSLRISAALADLLLTLRVPLPGFAAARTCTAFPDTPVRVRQVDPPHDVTAVGGMA